jgi:formate hydrogenlyase transcriptional activator
VIEEAVATILTTLDMGEVFERTGVLLRKHFGGTRVAINRWRADEPLVAEVLLVNDVAHPTPAVGTTFAIEGTACGEAIRTRAPVSVEAVRAEGARYSEEKQLARYGYGALACFPLLAGDQLLGTLDIAHKPQEKMLCQCFRPAEQIAKLVAIGLQNSLMVSEIQRLNQLLGQENALLKDQIERAGRGWHYVAESAAMRSLVEKVRLVAASDTTVLVRGETGTGKEGIARLVHQSSTRQSGPFVAVNLAALPETLIESELFGHEKGAFTGAVRQKPGRFEQASGGTLFLDEIGDAPAPVQVKLLRALQEREIQRVGSDRTIEVDARIVAATNRPLEQLVDEGRFRADLYYRLNIFPIVLPPLRERVDDLRPLAEHLIERHCRQMHRNPPGVPDAVWERLQSYDWPGNVRELENLLERALILSPGPTLQLPDWSSSSSAALPSPSSLAAPPAAVRPFDDQVRDLLQQALDRTEGRIYGEGGAAALLGLKPTTLQGKLKRYGLR